MYLLSALPVKPLQHAVLLKQNLHGIRGLGAVGNPLLGLLGVNLDNLGFDHGVVVADLLDESAVAGLTGIRYHNAIEGGFFRAHSAKSDFYCHSVCTSNIQ